MRVHGDDDADVFSVSRWSQTPGRLMAASQTCNFSAAQPAHFFP